MRQGDGSDLLGPNDPRNADIGILYVGPEDSRQEILTAINTQELQGRKQIAIVLPEQGKAFRQPVEFDGLKNMRRSLKATLIFIAPPGPGPAEFARHRRFVVYSSLDSFRTALIDEGAPYNPRAKSTPTTEKKGGLLGRSRASRAREQKAPPPTPPTVPPAQVPPSIPAPPPTPRIIPAASAQPLMPPASSTRMPSPGANAKTSGPDAQTPIEDMDTHTLELENPTPGRGGAAALAGGAALGALAASALDDDDGLAPPVTPRQPQGGAVVPTAQGSSTSSSSTARPPDGRRGPAPLLLGQQTNTPRPGSAGSGKLPAAQPPGAQAGSGSGKLAAVSGKGGSPVRGGRGTKQLTPAQDAAEAPDASRTSPARGGGSGKLPVAIPVGVVPVPSAADSSAQAPAAGGVAPIPAAMAVTGTPGGASTAQRQVGLTPLPAPVSRQRQRSRGRRRLLLLLLLGLLTLLVIGGIVVSALGGPSGLATFGHLTATVTITPQSKIIQNNFLISGVTTSPNAAQRQVAARVITVQSDTKTATAKASGSVPAKQAVGMLTFINTTNSPLTLSPTPIQGNDGVAVSIYQNVTVPAAPSFTATVAAYAINAGSGGNIAAFDISRSCCTSGITVKNTAAFHGGQDAQPNSIIQQGDIDGAAQPLITQLTTDTQAAVKKQLKSNESVADNPANGCKPTTSATQKAGDHAPSVTVSVAVTCTEVVYDLAAAEKMASNLLPTNLPGGVDVSGYALVGPVVTKLATASVISAQGKVNINMQAAGRWVYQFSAQAQQLIKQQIAKQSKAEALNMLHQQVGLAKADISISSGGVMPAVLSDITINIVSVPGLTQGAFPATATPYVTVPAGGSTPTDNGTPNAGS